MSFLPSRALLSAATGPAGKDTARRFLGESFYNICNQEPVLVLSFGLFLVGTGVAILAPPIRRRINKEDIDHDKCWGPSY
ncbi:MAG: hypothetical protein Q8P67_15585 [archaeon]|nr:hypothetical protein [archaeon]